MNRTVNSVTIQAKWQHKSRAELYRVSERFSGNSDNLTLFSFDFPLLPSLSLFSLLQLVSCEPFVLSVFVQGFRNYSLSTFHYESNICCPAPTPSWECQVKSDCQTDRQSGWPPQECLLLLSCISVYSLILLPKHFSFIFLFHLAAGALRK